MELILPLVWAQTRNGYIFCHCIGNSGNARNGDEETLTFHSVGTLDMTAGAVAQFAPLEPSGSRVQIDDSSFGTDIFDNHQGLCRNDKSFDCCCTLDMKNGMISA